MTKAVADSSMGPVIIISGPTASGKTAAALEVCGALNGEVVSADSRQVYRFMDIGTAKPTVDQQRLVKHHLLSIRNPDERFTAHDFRELALPVIDGILAAGKLPVVTGGTGLYLKVLQEGIFSQPGIEDPGRPGRHGNQRRQREQLPLAELQSLLREKDPKAFSRIDINNPRRLIRALEVIETTGQSIVELWSQRVPAPYEFLHYYMEPDRDELQRRIRTRAEAMYQNGLVEETGNLLARGYDPALPSMSSIGYRECVAVLANPAGPDANRLTTSAALEKTVQRTRQYSRRQRTWFRNVKKTVVRSAADIIQSYEGGWGGWGRGEDGDGRMGTVHDNMTLEWNDRRS